jgi:23S rRNA G2445 N2-methylase RlmL
MPSSYFLTVASGLESFALEEAGWRWPLIDDSCSSTTQGKVFLTTKEPISGAHSAPAQPVSPLSRARPLLCTAERIFVQVLRLPALRPASTQREAAPGPERNSAEVAAVAVVQAADSDKWRRSAVLQHTLSATDASHGAHTADTLRFRVCVKMGGARSRDIAGPHLAAAFGSAIAAHMTGWSLDNGSHNAVQVYIQCNDQHVLVGLASSGAALSQRIDVPHPGLRSTIAWAAARLAFDEPPGLSLTGNKMTKDPTSNRGCLTVCDPFCGRGGLVLEAARDWAQQMTSVLLGDSAFVAGGSASTGVCQELRENLLASTSATTCTAGVVALDVNALPFRTASVDVILTDPPFGAENTYVRQFRIKTRHRLP